MNPLESAQIGSRAAMRGPARRVPVIPVVVQRHAEEVAILHGIRTRLCHDPHVKLHHLGRFDDRLAAHLDGLAVAGESSWSFCEALLESPESGSIFCATVRSIEERNHGKLDRLLAVAEALPSTTRQLTSAFGWEERARLTGVVAQLLAAPDPLRRLVGVTACGLHRVDPGLLASSWLHDASLIVRARSFRTAAELGLREIVSACGEAAQSDDAFCAFWAAWAGVLLGDRERALDALSRSGTAPGVHRARAFRLALQAANIDHAHMLLQRLAADPARHRWVIEGCGVAGNRTYLPWLLNQMPNNETARLAGEAFSLITGTDLALLDLERKPPENFESGPNDNPDDPNVDMDPDDGLPWPDPARVQKWWDANAKRFQPGVRYFMGAPVTREHCIDVLKSGFQRQRILAAHYLCLLEPGTPLFNTSAPAWRQQRLLAEMK